MNRVTIAEEIERNDKVLSLPQALSEIIQEVGKENFSPENLAKIILRDPSLTGRILRLSNSSFYQRYSEITTVNQAINILGVTTVKCLALSSSVLNPEKIALESGVDPKDFFTYILSVASAAEKIAGEVEYKAPEEATVAGLLNEIGILYLIHHYPGEYKKIIEGKIKSSSLEGAELQVFGIDHAEIGGLLARKWRLPENIINSISNHHDLSDIQDGITISNIVKLAVLMVNDRFSGYEIGLEERLSLIHKISNLLNISKERVDEISSALLRGTIDMAEYLGVDIGNIEDMLITANQEIWKSYLVIANLFKERQELSTKLLKEEHSRGAIESKNIAIATLSHYMNNAAMAIYGRSQLMRMMVEKGNTKGLMEKIESHLEVLDRSVKKIVVVLDEIKEITPIDEVEYHNMSEALNIDDRIEKRMKNMTSDLGELATTK